MNLLENYIIKVHNVIQCKNTFGTYIKVDMTVNCYGIVKRTEHIFFTQNQWNEARNKGYYLA